jgi:hypothetical protein
LICDKAERDCFSAPAYCGFNLNTFFDIFMLYGNEFDAQKAKVGGFKQGKLKNLAVIL